MLELELLLRARLAKAMDSGFFLLLSIGGFVENSKKFDHHCHHHYRHYLTPLSGGLSSTPIGSRSMAMATRL
jgi:hypothetical protein